MIKRLRVIHLADDAGITEFKGGVPAPVKPVETLRIRSGIWSNISTKALLEEEKRIKAHGGNGDRLPVAARRRLSSPVGRPRGARRIGLEKLRRNRSRGGATRCSPDHGHFGHVGGACIRQLCPHMGLFMEGGITSRLTRNSAETGSLKTACTTTRFSANRQPQFGVARVARFRRPRPPRPSYPRPGDAPISEFPPEPADRLRGRIF